MTAGDRVRVFACVVAVPAAVFGAWTLLLGLGFGWLHGLSWAARIINWFTVPTAVGHVVTWVAAPFTALNLQEVLPVTRGIGAVCPAPILVGLWWWSRRDERSAVAGMVWSMVAVLLLEPSTLPWYYTDAVSGGGVHAAGSGADVRGVSTFMLVVYQPDDSIWFYRPAYLLPALAVSVLAAASLTRRDPLRLGRSCALPNHHDSMNLARCPPRSPAAIAVRRRSPPNTVAPTIWRRRFCPVTAGGRCTRCTDSPASSTTSSIRPVTV